MVKDVLYNKKYWTWAVQLWNCSLLFNPSYHGNADTKKNLQSQTLGISSRIFIHFMHFY